MNRESDISTQILVNGVERKLSSKTEGAIFRVVQEALNNIKRHSKAGEVFINLQFTVEYLKMTIEDNGQGFNRLKRIDKYAAKGKLGIIGMRQRINFIGGTLQIRSKLGKGTRLAVKVKC
jgi:two-component system sensor histidine kinase DegS